MDRSLSKIMTEFKNDLKRVCNKDELKFQFLMRRMMYDLDSAFSESEEIPMPSSIYNYLKDDESFRSNDLILECGNRCMGMRKHETLTVVFSPWCKMVLENKHKALQMSLMDKLMTVYQIKYRNPEILAKWIVRQKQDFELYMTEWNNIVDAVAKKDKTNRMALLAIKAIFKEAMKDCPMVKYDLIEQSRRVRIRVEIPNSNLGVNIYAYYGSYKKRLPEQIESLKQLLDTHGNICLNKFFTHTH